MSQSSVVLGTRKWTEERTLYTAIHISLIVPLTVDLPIQYAEDKDCCDSPDPKNLRVNASLSP